MVTLITNNNWANVVAQYRDVEELLKSCPEIYCINYSAVRNRHVALKNAKDGMSIDNIIYLVQGVPKDSPVTIMNTYHQPIENNKLVDERNKTKSTIDVSQTADQILMDAAYQIQDRAKLRDTEAERSMKKCVDAFNILYNKNLTETEGWEFMSILKKARGSQGAFHIDDYIDDTAYCALAAESEAKQNAIKEEK